ncbi:MAG: nitrilase-related carbon-nitrogen hydrolase, partial [Candidatus Baltobacteraceae bacterium]
MPSSLKLAVVQSKPRKGDVAANFAELGELFVQLAGEAQPYDLIVLPEAALTGYFLEGAVYE